MSSFALSLKVYNRLRTRKDHHMVRNRRQWIFGILFWIVFLTSIWLGLGGRYAWLDSAWTIVRFAILAAASTLVVVTLHRTRKRAGEYFYERGAPRFIASIFMDDEDLEKRRLFRGGVT
jgi:hypothetical protein